MPATPRPLIERYVREAAAWRPPVDPELLLRNPDLALGAEWNPPPGPEALARLHELGLDRVPALAELYLLHDGARLPSLGSWRLLPLAEVIDLRAGDAQARPRPPGDAVVVFSDDNEFAVGVYTSGPLAGALFEYDESYPEPMPAWRDLDEFLTVLLAQPDPDDWPGSGAMPTTLPALGPDPANRDRDWRVASELYALVRDPASLDDPLSAALTMTPYEHSDVLLQYLGEEVAASETAVSILGRRRWPGARARIAEVAAWPMFGEARRHNAALAAQRALAEWDEAGDAPSA